MTINRQDGGLSHISLLTSHSRLTPAVLAHSWPGHGTDSDPYKIEFLPNDPGNPMAMPEWKKWMITVIMAIGTFSVTSSSTTFSGAIPQIQEDFGVAKVVATLTVSLFVLGFVIGPMLWAPLSEMYGRQYIYLLTFGMGSLFGGASLACTENLTGLLVLRFLSGAFSGACVNNSAGVIADMFQARERGLALTIYCSAPFMGPTIGPFLSGFLASAAGWYYCDVLTVCLIATMLVIGGLLVPETYAPRLLICRARSMSKVTGKVYRSKVEAEKGTRAARVVFREAMVRPWILLGTEPIVLLIAVYAAIIYGILFLALAAFPIVFGGVHGWSQGLSGLSFLGVIFGQVTAVFFYLWLDARHKRTAARLGGVAPAEERLPPALIGAPALPIGLFIFAWTTFASVHWIAPIIGASLFGFGQVLLFISMMNYTVDSYTIFAASALAANAILRSLFGAAFPLFTPQMYASLGPQWASSIPAFLSLACTPLPFLFRRYGKAIRDKCKYSAESQRVWDALINAQKLLRQDESSVERLTDAEKGGVKE